VITWLASNASSFSVMYSIASTMYDSRVENRSWQSDSDSALEEKCAVGCQCGPTFFSLLLHLLYYIPVGPSI
jgi:hypothetical protein